MKATFSITFVIAPAVVIPPIAIAQSSFSGTVGVPLTGDLGITGGTAPYNLSADPSLLPPGVNLDATGALSGTPTQDGTFSLVVGISDATEPPPVVTPVVAAKLE